MIRTDLGIATAYAEAVSKGYTGTRDEFGQMFADFGKTAEKVTEDKKAVEQMKLSVEETKNSVDTTASEFGQNVADKTEEAKAAITEHANTEKESATAAISEAKDAATGAITEAQTSATDAIASAKDSATAEIAKKGTDTLATIPDDYTALTKEVGSLKENLGEYDSKLRNLVEVDATEVIANKLIKLKSKEEYDLMGSCYIKQNIPSSVRKIKVSGRSASAEYGYSLGAFYKADGTFISTFGDDNDTRYTDLKVDVPDGTSFIYVNQDQIASEKYEKVKFFVVFDVINNMEKALQDIIELKSNLHNKANSPKDKKEIELDNLTQGGLIKVDGTILPFSGYEYGYTNAQLGDEFYVTGNAWKNTLPVFAEFDANNNVVRSFTGDDSLSTHEGSVYKEQYFRVQNEKTTRVGFNGSTSGEYKLSVKKNTILSVEECVNQKTSKLYADVDNLSIIKYGDCVKKPYTFNAKRCDVFGDSIARGWVHWDTTKYPITENNWVKLFCDKVGMTFSNHAVGGSTSKGVLSQITGVGELTSDYVFVAFGVNDWQDAIALNDFRNNVNAICNALKENFTGIDVIFITPINHAEIIPHKEPIADLQEYRNIITEVALSSEYSVVQGNTFPFPDKNGEYASLVFGDGNHPTEKIGYPVYANSLSAKLN